MPHSTQRRNICRRRGCEAAAWRERREVRLSSPMGLVWGGPALWLSAGAVVAMLLAWAANVVVHG